MSPSTAAASAAGRSVKFVPGPLRLSTTRMRWERRDAAVPTTAARN
jgi:hypothetical protein